jgi:hypothetical protein
MSCLRTPGERTYRVRVDMAHLDVDGLVGVLTGVGLEAEHDHLERCADCRAELDSWRRRLPVLKELTEETIDSDEEHMLRVMFRQLGPAGRRSWIARFVRRSDPGPEPVAVPARGALSSSLEEYRAGPWSIVLQIRPSDTCDGYDVHGQLTGSGGERRDGGEVVVASDRGHGCRSTLDSFGEFRLSGLPADTYRASWVLGEEHIDLNGLEIGNSDDSSGG